ncbi:MAG: galactose-1-phosphate uridylyltransferase [Acidimicrobiales bacterium]|nr:galactose-1-phosphate uridylyltransferase [Acidimicrobiales bacterium]
MFVVEQYCHFADLDGRDTEPTTRHLWLERDGEVLAYARLLAGDDGQTTLSRVVTRRDARAAGIGGRLVAEAVRLADGPVHINAQAQLAPWYERQGFTITGRFFYEDNMPHFPMRHDGSPSLVEPTGTTVTSGTATTAASPLAALVEASDLPYRIDPLTGDVGYIVAERQARPMLPSSGCPFCPGGLEAPEPYDVFSFTNRWPAIPEGRCEVVLYTSDHDATFASLGLAGARRVVDLWAARTAALGARDDVGYVLVFENRGPEVGATIAHPHGQIYAFDLTPPRARDELERADAAAFAEDAPGAGDERLVSVHRSWRAWVPWAAGWPYELLLAPRTQVPDLPSLDDDGRDDLAATLVDVTDRLDRLFDAPMPYMLWIHQRPFDGNDWPAAWLHVHITPLYRRAGTQRYMAAGELGSDVFFNPVDPTRAAADLRAAGADAP